MNVLVYVEGPSDRDGLGKILRSVIALGRTNRVGIRFVALGNKDAILDHSPRKAASHLTDHPDDWVFALPDLYPMSSYSGTPNAHASFADLRALLSARFQQEARRQSLDASLHDRFRVHCLKHDLEVLLLAAKDQLRDRLGTRDALGRWRQPVEDQNDDTSPKYVVAPLFQKYRRRNYVDTTDAPWILERAELSTVEAACRQCFAPFVSELRTLAAGGSLP